MKKIGQNFVDAVRSMTAKEIIMHMVESLRNPVTEIKMSTYGQTNGIKCFGCAATNFIAHKLNYSKEDLIEILPDMNLVQGFSHSAENDSVQDFIERFEHIIDFLRMANIKMYNIYARGLGIAEIYNVEELKLPRLGNDFTDSELEMYIRLAESQEK